MLRRMKRLRQKRGTDAQIAHNVERADRLLAQVRLLRKWNQQTLCKELLGHEAALDQLLSAASGSVTPERLALARLAETGPVRQFVNKFRASHSDWRDLVYFMQYKNTGGRWKKKKLPARVRAPNNLLADSVKAIAAMADEDGNGDDDRDNQKIDEDVDRAEEAERRRRLESVLLEFRKETAGERGLSVAMDADLVGIATTRFPPKEAKSSAKVTPKIVVSMASESDGNKISKYVAKDAESDANKSSKTVAKAKKPVAKVQNSLQSDVQQDAAVVKNNDKKSEDMGDGWSDLFAIDVPPMEMKRGLHRGQRITTDGGDALTAPRHGERQSRKRRREVQAQERRSKQATMESEQLHPSWQAKRQQKARQAAAATAAPARIVFDDDD